MDSDTGPYKQSPRAPAETLRMVGDADIRLVRDIGQRQGKDARILEVGPFLGGVSVELARFGELSVIDRFTWSEANAARFPGIAEAGASFRPAFEAALAAAPAAATICETDYRSGAWPEGPFDLCFIDAPRTAPELLACLRHLVGRMTGSGVVMVKHGISAAHPEMGALVAGLLTRDCFRLVPTDQAAWCTIAVLEVADGFAALSDMVAEELLQDEALSAPEADPWGGARFQLSRLAERAVAGDWARVFTLLDQLVPGTDRMAAWDGFEPVVAKAGGDPAMLAVLAELMAVQTEISELAPAAPIDLSPTCALRGYWRNNAGEPWRVARFDPALLVEAQAEGAMALPQLLLAQLRGRRVVEIGRGLGLSAAGFLATGAAAYTGVDLEGARASTVARLARLPGAELVSQDGLDAADLSGTEVLVLHQSCIDAAEGLRRRLAASVRTLVVERLPEGRKPGWRLLR